MTRIIMMIATGFYAGYLPKAPGTWGSAVGLLLCFLLSSFPLKVFLGILAGLLVIGFFTAGSAEKILDRKDPGQVVIDEIVGMLITLTGAQPDLFTWGLGFFIFRFFDILKPFPIRWIDRRIQGGAGIMLDDVVAGIYSFLVLQGILRVWG